MFSEGFGFSNNPELGFSLPDHDDVLIAVNNGRSDMDISIAYIFNEEQKDRRRRSRR